MNLNQRNFKRSQPQSNTAADRFINELSDPNSLWYRLKVSEMPGGDYLFVPKSIWAELVEAGSVHHFLTKVQALLGSSKTRITVVSFHFDGENNLQLHRHTPQWADSRIVSLTETGLIGTPQYNYVKTLFDHSDALLKSSGA